MSQKIFWLVISHVLSQQIILVLTDGITSHGMYYESTTICDLICKNPT